jgi:hypothetical protein
MDWMKGVQFPEVTTGAENILFATASSLVSKKPQTPVPKMPSLKRQKRDNDIVGLLTLVEMFRREGASL